MSSMAEERKPRRPRRSFSDEFKAGAVQRVLDGGRTIPQVARDLDLTESALRGWVEQAHADAGKGKPGALTSSEREELTRLRKENRELRMDREILEKSRGLLREREALRFGFIDEEKAFFPVSRLCAVLRVSRAGFYAWRSRSPSARQVEDEKLRILVREAHLRARRTYGSPGSTGRSSAKGSGSAGRGSSGSCSQRGSRPGHDAATAARR